MGSDYYFRMGSTHTVCQDYAIAGKGASGLECAILSDGCSGNVIPTIPGSPHTDFGARLVAYSALRRVNSIFENESFPSIEIITAASVASRALGLPAPALDATLLVAVRKGPLIRAFMTGDGTLVRIQSDGTIHYFNLSFGNGAPYYLSYLLNLEAQKILLVPDPEHRPEFAAEAGTVVVTRGVKPPNGEWLCESWIEYITLESPIERCFEFTAEDTACVLLLSDGAESFKTRNGTYVPLTEVLDHVCAFKGMEGEFIVKRCANGFQRFCQNNGWKHEDDLSIVGLTFLGD